MMDGEDPNGQTRAAHYKRYSPYCPRVYRRLYAAGYRTGEQVTKAGMDDLTKIPYVSEGWANHLLEFPRGITESLADAATYDADMEAWERFKVLVGELAGAAAPRPLIAVIRHLVRDGYDSDESIRALSDAEILARDHVGVRMLGEVRSRFGPHDGPWRDLVRKRADELLAEAASLLALLEG